MTKSKVKKELLTCTKGRPFISLSEICRVMHVGKDRAHTIVAGLSYFSTGRRKDFLVEDVARRIAEEAKPIGGERTRTIEIPREVIANFEQREDTEGVCNE